jgi:hypothetical protein
MTYSIEAAYNAIAEASAAAPDSQRELFLAKLALVLAHQVGDLTALRGGLDTALRDLDTPE